VNATSFYYYPRNGGLEHRSFPTSIHLFAIAIALDTLDPKITHTILYNHVHIKKSVG